MEDSGLFDEDRNLYVLGRLKDVINYGAALVYPGWLETKIVDHPDVVEACVVPDSICECQGRIVGVSDPVLCQQICAAVKLVPGSGLSEDKLRWFCQDMFINERVVEMTPVPKFYLILEDFPLLSNGKVDKVTLQKMAEDRFGSN